MITLATAVAVFERWRGRPPERAEALSGGIRNAVFRLDDWVARFYTRDATAHEREASVLRLLAGDVRVPEIAHSVAGDPPCTFLRYIEGIPFQELDADGRKRAGHSIGRELAQVSRHSGTGLAPPRKTTLASALASSLLLERLGPHARAMELVASWAPSPEHTLVHGDFRKWNVIVRDDRCVGIIDWENAHAGSPLEDIGQFLRYERDARPRIARELAEGFIEGGGVLPDDWRRQSRIFDLRAICRSLADPALPSEIVEELLGVVEGSLEDLEEK